MTLLLGYASPEFAVLASDQMITWSKEVRVGRRCRLVQKFSETTIKATFFRGQYLIGFSGVADLGWNTEEWLIQQLAPLASRPAMTQWRQRLTSEISSELARLHRKASQSWLSLMVVAAPGLHVPGVDFRLWAVGNVPPPSLMHEAADAIKRYRNRHPNNSLEIARTLARIIVRRSHELKGRGVGTAVQVTVMPRAALGQEWISMGLFQDPLDGVTSIEFNPRRRTADGHPIFTGPNLVCDGMVLTSPAMAFGSFEEIGPREPFREPEHQGRSGPQTRRGAASGVPAKVVLPELVRIAVEAGLEG